MTTYSFDIMGLVFFIVLAVATLMGEVSPIICALFVLSKTEIKWTWGK